jgi:hypothetical protein
MLEQKFKTWLKERGFKQSTIYDYDTKLVRFCRRNGYNNFEDLADDVFILLDKGEHSDRHFDEPLLEEIEKYEAVLKKFNGFLFVIGYRRDFVMPCSASTNFMFALSVKTKSTNITPCVLHETIEGKDWCTAKEICGTILIADSELRYLRNIGKPPHCYVVGKRRYRYKIDEVNRFIANSFPKYQERC